MRLERIISIKGGRAQTQNGFFSIIGNASMAAGQIIPGFDGHVIGRVNPTGRRPVWETTPEAQGDIPVAKPLYYHFADASALKMYYVDLEFSEIVKTETITPPVENAALLAHCYDANNEYMVWFLDSRCIIQNNGETVADFISVLTHPYGFDAYINGSDLVWGASDGTTCAVYQNAQPVQSNTIDSAEIEEVYNSRIVEKLKAVSFSAAVTNVGPEVTESITVYSPIPRNQVIYDAYYTNCNVSTESYGIYSDVDVGSFALNSYFDADALFSVRSYGTVFIQAHVHAIGTDTIGGLALLDQSYDAGGLSVSLNNAVIMRVGDGSVCAEIQEPSGDMQGTTDVPYSIHVTEEYETDAIDLNASVVSGLSTPSNSTSGFWVIFDVVTDDTHSSSLLDTMFMYYNFNVSAEINGETVTRSGKLLGGRYNANDKTRSYYHITFTEQWPVIPSSVVITAYRGVQTAKTKDCTVVISAAFETINSGGAEVITPIGNNYSVRSALTLTSVYGYSDITHSLLRSGSEIYGGGTDVVLEGPWSVGSTGITGITTERDHKLIVAKGNNVTVSDFSLFNGTVTKRFVAK